MTYKGYMFFYVPGYSKHNKNEKRKKIVATESAERKWTNNFVLHIQNDTRKENVKKYNLDLDNI